MEEEIRIGDKTYKVEDFYKLSEDRFQKIYQYVNSMEHELFNKILDNTSTKEDISKLKFIQGITKRLHEMDIKRLKEKYSINDYTINPQDDIDIEYNEVINGINNAYENAQRKIEEEIKNVEEKEESIIKEIDNNEASELSSEVLEAIKEMNNKKNSLRSSYNGISNEANGNIQAINHKFVPNSLTEPKRGFFARLFDRLNPKRIEKRVYKAKKGRLAEIAKKIQDKIKSAGVQNKNRNSRILRAKAIGASLLAAFSMTASAASLSNNKEIYEEPAQKATVDELEKNMSFTEIDKVSDISAKVDQNGHVSIESKVNDEKINEGFNVEAAVYDEARTIYNETGIKGIPYDQIHVVVSKYIDIDTMDISNEEKVRLINEYLNDDSDGLTREGKIEIITKARTVINKSKERKAQTEITKSEGQASDIQTEKENNIITPNSNTEAFIQDEIKENNSEDEITEIIENADEEEITEINENNTKKKKQKNRTNDVQENQDEFEDVDIQIIENDELNFEDVDNSLAGDAINSNEVEERENSTDINVPIVEDDNNLINAVQQDEVKHTLYDDVVNYNQAIDNLVSSVPLSNLAADLSAKFGGFLSREDIQKIIDNNESITDIKKELKRVVVQGVLGNKEKSEMPDSFAKDYKTLDDVFKSCPTESLYTNLRNNFINIDNSVIDQVFTDKGSYTDGVGYSKQALTRDEYKAKIKAEIDYRYKVSKLKGNAAEAYRIIEAIEKEDTHGADKSHLLIGNLKKYIDEQELFELYNEVYNSPNISVTTSETQVNQNQDNTTQKKQTADVIIYTDENGNQYAYVNGNREEVDDKFIEDMQNAGVTYEYDDGNGNGSIDSSMSFEEAILNTAVYEESKSKESIFIEKLKEKALDLNEEKSDIYKAVSNCYRIYRNESSMAGKDVINPIIASRLPQDIPEFSDMVRKGLIKSESIYDIVNDSNLSNSEKIKQLSKLIESAKEEYEASPEKKSMFETIKTASKQGYAFKIDEISKQIPLNDMNKAGVLSIDDLRSIVNNNEYTAEQKEKMIKKAIEDAQKKMKDMEYDLSADGKRWEAEHNGEKTTLVSNEQYR